MSEPSEHEWTDEEFIPQDQPDAIEDLRQYIRQRLYQGATQREIEDEITGHGLDPEYAIQLVSSVRTTGQYGELELGTELLVNGAPAGFFKNPVSEKKLRLMKRQRLRQRETSGKTNEPNPALDFGPATTQDQGPARQQSRERHRLLVIAGVIALAAVAVGAYLLSR